MNVLVDGKPLVIIYVGCAHRLDSTAIWRKAQAVIPRYPNLTLGLMAADLKDQPPLWANANGPAGLREISQSTIGSTGSICPACGLFPSYLSGPAGPENLTVSVAKPSPANRVGQPRNPTVEARELLSAGGNQRRERPPAGTGVSIVVAFVRAGDAHQGDPPLGSCLYGLAEPWPKVGVGFR